MKNSILIKTWEALTEAQRRQVGKAVQSPLFNQREEVGLLFDFIIKNSDKKSFTKEAAFQFIYNKKTYDDGKMRHLMGYLLEVIRLCLAWEEWSEDEAEINLGLCRVLKKTGLTEVWERELTRAKSELEKQSFRHDGYYFQRFFLEQETWELGRQKHRGGVDNVADINGAFGAYVAINSLRQGCTLLAQQTLTNVSASIPYLPETLRLIEQGFFANNAAVETWHASYVALAEPEQEIHFIQLKKLLAQNGAIFPEADLRDLYVLALNVCIRRINAADKKYMREAFDLYRGGLARKVFLENGYLSKTTYRNVLNIAVAVGEWEWAREYLDAFQTYLPPRESDNIYRYNLATYYFRKREYDQALDLLRHVELRDMLENFDARRMMVRMYYELGEIQALDSLLDSFDIYLRRHKEGGYHREMYRNFVRFLKKMISPALPTCGNGKN
ncbi:MAG: hypothetical protein IPN33_10245 [Saprospiraceae bacterium]|nr:hypothetical protein [Saprospiraceae bacterium]